MFERRLKFRRAAIEKFGGKCAHCGYNQDSRALQFDHVAGGAYSKKGKERHSSNPLRYFDIMNAAPGTYQLLCANCNVIKRDENGELNDIGRKNSEIMKKHWEGVRNGTIPPRNKATSYAPVVPTPKT